MNKFIRLKRRAKECEFRLYIEIFGVKGQETDETWENGFIKTQFIPQTTVILKYQSRINQIVIKVEKDGYKHSKM